MPKCNYLPMDTASEIPSLYLDELFDLDIICTEEGILINCPEPELSI